jgi:hypothetical protein
MGVQAVNPLGGVGGGEIWTHPGREVRPLGLASGKIAHGRKDFAVVIAGGKRVEDFVDPGDSCRRGGLANG